MTLSKFFYLAAAVIFLLLGLKVITDSVVAYWGFALIAAGLFFEGLIRPFWNVPPR